MLLKIFTVYDSKVESYMNPFFCKSVGEALRSFQEIANDKNHQIGKYPADFTLFEIGTYNDENGRIEMFDALKSIGLALEYVRQEPVNLPANVV